MAFTRPALGKIPDLLIFPRVGYVRLLPAEREAICRVLTIVVWKLLSQGLERTFDRKPRDA
jgi:hypothetical protein